ncbi:MAG TPA: biotin carboxylase N-terminal domain-containing protein [Xanthomonadaceae bacterium]|nr:biotin carboxylase N-terminal domain-containing protein [Xanthomonadaceae bacterium]
MFSKVLIANRGEIACRVMRTCRRLGIATVAVHSSADDAALHVREADQARAIGGAAPSDSYLCGERIVEAARATGAEAIHPGYGFLSENADFAEAVVQAGLVFIGPDPASMRKMGSKAGAKTLMDGRGVPVVPGYTGQDQDPALLAQEAARIGFPLMIKAAHGGGGKGMRIVRDADGFAEALASCQREARGAFGRDRVLLERYVERPRHIEFQIFGDRHGNLIHLNERECSAQRRYQKVMEESPSPFLDPDLRQAMGQAAVAAGRAIDYVNAGTVEFIVAPSGEFWFMEINTRLQVEHTVTEMTTGLDLVEWQLRVAAGEALPLAQEQVRSDGHAIQVRVYAEDPDQGFLPGSGRLRRLRLPDTGRGVRVDAGVEEGDEVTVHYDPMIAKLIVHAGDRNGALARAADALRAFDVVGPKSNLAFLERLLAHPVVVAGEIHTAYLDEHLDEFLEAGESPPALAVAAAAAMLLEAERETALARSAPGPDPHSPWSIADGWRLAHASRQTLAMGWREARIEFDVLGHPDHFTLDHAGATMAIRVKARRADAVVLDVDGVTHRIPARPSGEDLLVHWQGRHRFHPVSAFLAEAAADEGTDLVRAPMPGRVVALHVAQGEAVDAGAPLLVMEAMKMELTLRAPQAGTVAEVRNAAGDFVEADTVLVRMEGS